MPFQKQPAPKIVDRFVAYLETQGYAQQTRHQYRSYLRRLHDWLDGRELRELSTGDLEDFLLDCYGHLTYATRYNATCALRTYCDWLRRRGQLTSNPAEDLPWPKKPRKRPTYYEPEQAARLLRGFSHPVDRLITLVLLRQGQRLTPTITLRWGQVDFGRAVVRYESAKGGPPMTMPLDLDTGRELKAWKALHPDSSQDDYVFEFRYRTKHRQADGYRKALRRACRAQGVPYRGPHELRRTTATTLLQMGEPLHRVSRHLLGHANLQTTVTHYAGSDDSDLGSALGRLPF